MPLSPQSVEIGDFLVRDGVSEGRVWIERLTGPHAGEGGDFPIEQVSQLLGNYYAENF